jgi:2-hydroxyacylsphingosine 1-beta-galactosyltransferase
VDARLLWKVTLQERAAFDLRARPRDSVFFLGESDLSPGDADATVLSRAHASVVVTAGNLPTVQEALVAGVPIIGVPFSADQVSSLFVLVLIPIDAQISLACVHVLQTSDQWENVNAVARAGGGLTLDGAQFSAQSVHDSVQRLLHESMFTRAATRLGQIVAAAGGAPRAAETIEAVLLPSPRGAGDASFLLPVRNLQPLYKTYLVDVYFVYGVILCGAFVIVRTFLAVVLAVFQPLVDELDLEDLDEDERAALAEAAGVNASASGIPEHGGRRKTAY